MRSDEGEQLVEVFGDEERRRAARPLLPQGVVDRLGRADVDAARRVDGDDQAGPTGQLAREQQLLLVAAGEGAQLGPAAGRLDVVVGDQAVGKGGDRACDRKGPLQSGGRR